MNKRAKRGGVVAYILIPSNRPISERDFAQCFTYLVRQPKLFHAYSVLIFLGNIPQGALDVVIL